MSVLVVPGDGRVMLDVLQKTWPTAATQCHSVHSCLLSCLTAQECEALGVAAPALTQLDEIAADIAAVKGSWVVYQEFLSERDELAHKDWLSMRDQVC